MTGSESTSAKVMRIIWEGEGHTWDELYEYPYTASERAKIMKRLEETANRLMTEKLISVSA